MSVNNIDYHTLTVGTSAVGLADASPAVDFSKARGAVINLEAAQIRWRDDGTAPTTTEGHLLSPGDSPLLYDSWTSPGNNWKQVLRAIRFIRVGGTSGALKISSYD